jgi:hypothetical protein
MKSNGTTPVSQIVKPPIATFLVSLVLVFGTALNALQAEAQDATHADVVVYGGTPGGVTAAIAASRDGASVVLLEQTKHVGGLSTSGLNRDEGEHMDRSTLGGLSEQFTFEAARRSGTQTENAEGARMWQSRIAEQVFLDMLKKAGVPIRYEQFIEKVEKTGARITKLRVRGGRVYQAKVFIDATYEGDLMAAAGVSYTVGREARDTYNESKAGVRYRDEKVFVSPYDEEGNLLFGVMPGKPPAEFSASKHPICYNVRLNLTSDTQVFAFFRARCDGVIGNIESPAFLPHTPLVDEVVLVHGIASHVVGIDKMRSDVDHVFLFAFLRDVCLRQDIGAFHASCSADVEIPWPMIVVLPFILAETIQGHFVPHTGRNPFIGPEKPEHSVRIVTVLLMNLFSLFKRGFGPGSLSAGNTHGDKGKLAIV